MLSELWRYPVKSMGGESLSTIAIAERGLDRDRSWAVVDVESGLVASAKYPARWSRLLQLAVNVDETDQITVSWPDGETLSTASQRQLDHALSEYLDRSVTLRRAQEVQDATLQRTDPDPQSVLDGGEPQLLPVKKGPLGAAAPKGTLFDYAPVHVIATPTLDALESAGGASAGDARRFRPNLVIDLDGPAFLENAWPGMQLAFDGGVRLDVIMQSPRCVVPSLAQRTLPRSVEAIRAVARNNRIEIEGHGMHSCAGVYASVATAGHLSRGAAVQLIGAPGPN